MRGIHAFTGKFLNLLTVIWVHEKHNFCSGSNLLFSTATKKNEFAAQIIFLQKVSFLEMNCLPFHYFNFFNLCGLVESGCKFNMSNY